MRERKDDRKNGGVYGGVDTRKRGESGVYQREGDEEKEAEEVKRRGGRRGETRITQ